MTLNWRAFVRNLERKDDVRDLPSLIVECLKPPVFVEKALSDLKYLCRFCFNPMIDSCAICGKSVCEKHGEEHKLNFVWHFCPTCQNNENKLEEIKEMEKELAEEHPDLIQEENIVYKPEIHKAKEAILSLTCTDCGEPLFKVKKHRYECRNRECPVVHIDASGEELQIIHDPTHARTIKETKDEVREVA